MAAHSVCAYPHAVAFLEGFARMRRKAKALSGFCLRHLIPFARAVRGENAMILILPTLGILSHGKPCLNVSVNY